MTSEIGKTLRDDEYQFPQEEYGNEIHAMKEAKIEEEIKQANPSFKEQIPGLLEKLSFAKHKRIYITIGIIGFAFVFFKIMKPHRQVIQTTPVAAAPQAVTVMPRAEASAEIVGQLNSLKQQQFDSQSAVSTLQSQVQSLRQEINQNSNSQAQLTQSMAALVSEFKKLSDDLQKNSSA